MPNPYQVPNLSLVFHSAHSVDGCDDNGNETKGFLEGFFLPAVYVFICAHFVHVVAKGGQLPNLLEQAVSLPCAQACKKSSLAASEGMKAEGEPQHPQGLLTTWNILKKSVHLQFQQGRRPAQQKYWLYLSQRLSSISLL